VFHAQLVLSSTRIHISVKLNLTLLKPQIAAQPTTFGVKHNENVPVLILSPLIWVVNVLSAFNPSLGTLMKRPVN